MKKVSMVLLFALVTIVSYGQISLSTPTEITTIGKVGGGMVPFIADLTYTKGDSENNYTLSFNDLKFTHITAIKSIEFKGNEEMVNGLYGILKELINGDSGVEKEFNIGKEYMVAKSVSMVGVKSLKIYGTDTGNMGYFYLTKRQLDKLFGK